MNELRCEDMTWMKAAINSMYSLVVCFGAGHDELVRWGHNRFKARST
jgi:hypothetical protein